MRPIALPPTIATGAILIIAPVAPMAWSPANAEPATTFPIPDWTPAAIDPAKTPWDVKPAPAMIAWPIAQMPAPDAAPVRMEAIYYAIVIYTI